MSDCEMRLDGVHEACCLHDLPNRTPLPGGQVCCWCGIIYASRHDERDAHGEYEPGLSKAERQKREVKAADEVLRIAGPLFARLEAQFQEVGLILPTKKTKKKAAKNAVCTCSYEESEEMTRHAPLCAYKEK